MLEGVAFGIKDSFRLLAAAGVGSADEVRISGGGARSALWRQIMADVLGVRVVTVNTKEGAAFGAALLAGVGAGFYEDVPAACRETIRVTGETLPGAAHAAYPAYYKVYRSLYPALAPHFQAIAALPTPAQSATEERQMY